MKVLHVPYTYFPDEVGGTEVYVAGLCEALEALGIVSNIAAPASDAARYQHAGIPVFRFAVAAEAGLNQAYGGEDRTAAAQFEAVIDEVGPAILHLHSRSAAVSPRLVRWARARGCKVVLTYHTPTISCVRGTMLYRGLDPCDGEVREGRCVACVIEGAGVPRALARVAGSPPAIAASRRAPERLRVPWLIADHLAETRKLFAEVDHLVAVCEWVRQVMLRNGVPEHRISLSRQGVRDGSRPKQSAPYVRSSGPLRIAYFGRADPTKGSRLLVEAVMAAKADLALDLHLVSQGDEQAMADLSRLSARDPRISVRAPLPPADVQAAMARYDLIAVPSRWLETGPLVVLEAFAAGTPVIGSALGGIAELVRDGVDGILLPAGDRQAWTECIEQVTFDQLALLRGNIRPPCTMDDAAADMASLYRRILHPAGAGGATTMALAQ